MTKKRTTDLNKYNADITAGSLLYYETRQVVKCILDGMADTDIRKAVEEDNILQKRSVAPSKRIYSLIKNRLNTVKNDKNFLELIYNSDAITAKQAMLVLVLRNSKLMANFMVSVIQPKYRTYETSLTKLDWEQFLDELGRQDPEFPTWSDKKKTKIRDCIFRVLVEVGYLSQDSKLVRVIPDNRVIDYLVQTNDNFIKQCLEVAL